LPRPRRSSSKEPTDGRVVGLGGVFLRVSNVGSLSEWYSKHLGIKIGDNIALFGWESPKSEKTKGVTVWALFPKDSDYFPEGRQFMINYRVRNLAKVLRALRKEGVQVDEKVEKSKYGKFGWVHDPDGNKIELWEPPPKRAFSKNETLME